MAVLSPVCAEHVAEEKAQDAKLARTLRRNGHYAESAQIPPVATVGPFLRGAAASKGLPTSVDRISCQPVSIQEAVPEHNATISPSQLPGTKYIIDFCVMLLEW